MRVAYIGNFGPQHSTENHVASAWERLGHEVVRLQENNRDAWDLLDHPAEWLAPPDLILWTRTGWDWEHDCGWDHGEAMDRQDAMLDAASGAGIPTVGFHLDRWWGLNREGQVLDEAFFRCDLVCTADGGHQAEWEEAGVNHRWLPPAVSLAETEREGRPMPRQYPGQVAFVGSWRPGYHAEWDPHRQAMLRACRRRFGRRFQTYPKGRSLRGQPLADLYATIPVLVGDSCLAPIDDPPARYWSDRIPETLGRGGILVHPQVEGLREEFLTSGLVLYGIGDYDGMLAAVEDMLAISPEERALCQRDGRRFVQEHHTYERRVEQLLEFVGELDRG